MASSVKTRLRRKSSSLGGELRGDTGASALSTLEPTPTASSTPPLSPRPSYSSKPPRRQKRRKVRSLIRRWINFSFRHTWINPLTLMLILLSAYLVYPRPSNPLHRAIFLSYPLPRGHPLIPTHAIHDPDAPTYYGKGINDFAFVAFYIIVLSFTREFLMQRLIRPLAISYGIRSRSKQNRFMEQAYTAIYFAVFGPFGLYIMYRTPVWYFDTVGMFEDFPHRSHEAMFKAYYLLQASYWAQQAIVLMLQLEKPRKDFKELVAHHIVTIALIWLSYRFHFTYMGLAVYITHDISDFFLATSKTLNYISSPIIVPFFTVFMVIWAYLRHYVNLVILASMFTDFKNVGPFELNWETQQYKCWLSQCITFALLAALQAINIFWFSFIIRIAVNMVKDHVEKDIRSDDEDDDEVEEDPKTEKKTAANGLLKDEPHANGSAGGLSNGTPNGTAPEGHESYAEAVTEGTKEQ